jgi:hypothetical protein
MKGGQWSLCMRCHFAAEPGVVGHRSLSSGASWHSSQSVGCSAVVSRHASGLWIAYCLTIDGRGHKALDVTVSGIFSGTSSTCQRVVLSSRVSDT